MIGRAHLILALQIVGASVVFMLFFTIIYRLMGAISRPTNYLDGDIYINGTLHASGFRVSTSGNDDPAGTLDYTGNGNRTENATIASQLLVVRKNGKGYMDVGAELAAVHEKIQRWQEQRSKQKQLIADCMAAIDTSTSVETGSGASSAMDARLKFVEGMLVCFMMSDPELFEFPRARVTP
jgi:hypothetical protein